MSKKVPEIFECEYQLMLLVWKNKKPTRMRQLVADGFEARNWKRTTIYTMVKRLSDRGVLKFEDGFVTAKFSKEQVQLAKAAIAAGIRMLMERLGITEDEISSVYIAGAFGNYMDPVSAGKIGLLPATLVKKVKPVGNAAGEGAKIALVNEKEMLEMDELVRKIEFVELAASADFQDYFIDELGFETGE